MKGKGTKYGQKVFGGQSVVGLKTARMIKKYKPVGIFNEAIPAKFIGTVNKSDKSISSTLYEIFTTSA